MAKYSIEELESKYRGSHVVFIGNGPSAKLVDIPEVYKDKDCYFWTCSAGWIRHPYADLGWYMDDIMGPDMRVMPSNDSYDVRIQKMTETNIPVITSTAYPIYETHVQYPLERVLKHFNIKEPYFAETANYVVAWASMIGVKEMDFHGVDFINIRPEERAALEYWCGRVSQVGMKLNINPQSHFMRTQSLDGINRHVPGLYGYLPQNVPIPYTIQANGTTRFKVHD